MKNYFQLKKLTPKNLFLLLHILKKLYSLWEVDKTLLLIQRLESLSTEVLEVVEYKLYNKSLYQKV